jgi:prepilin-type N-terminal cleavage/methylation domain-containing protein
MQASLERLRQRRAERGDEGGFTLIELLIVIVILGILAAIVVFAVQNLTTQSAKAACGSDLKTVETATEAYKAQMGNYPDFQAVGGTGVKTDTGLAGDNAADLAGELLVNAATAPNNGTDATVGPWLKDVPKNTGHYTISVSNNGLGTVTVTNAGGTAGADCSLVS